jgi:hypothetical protein
MQAGIIDSLKFFRDEPCKQIDSSNLVGILCLVENRRLALGYDI